MKIFKISQFGRADELAQREYDRVMNESMINDIKIAVLSLVKNSENIKIFVKPLRNNSGSIDIKVEIYNVTFGSMTEKVLRSNDLKEKIKSICGVYPEIDIHTVKTLKQQELENKIDWNKIDWNKTNEQIVEEILEPIDVVSWHRIKSNPVDWDKVDWDKSDKQIAKITKNSIPHVRLERSRFNGRKRKEKIRARWKEI